MAEPTDTTFLAGFDPDEFRQAITSAMEMGLPNDEAERITFRWKTTKTFSGNAADRSGIPFDLNAAPVSVDETPDVRIPATSEITRIAPDGTAIGTFDHPYVLITVLDTHYEKIRGANMVILGGDDYKIDFVAPPFGLGPVTVYQIYATAVDES
jgi:hypothetical protein